MAWFQLYDCYALYAVRQVWELNVHQEMLWSVWWHLWWGGAWKLYELITFTHILVRVLEVYLCEWWENMRCLTRINTMWSTSSQSTWFYSYIFKKIILHHHHNHYHQLTLLSLRFEWGVTEGVNGMPDNLVTVSSDRLHLLGISFGRFQKVQNWKPKTAREVNRA